METASANYKTEFEYFLREKQTHVMMIALVTFKLTAIYFMIQKNPRCRSCGGFGILIKTRLKHHLLNDMCEDHPQTSVVCIVHLQNQILFRNRIIRFGAL